LFGQPHLPRAATVSVVSYEKGVEVNMSKLSVDIKTSSDGKSVIVNIAETSKDQIHISLPIDTIGAFVVGLLAAATECARKSGATENPFEQAGAPSQMPYAQARGVALTDTEKPDVLGLVLAFGSTQRGVGLPREALRPLGTALLAATADAGRMQ
jgi:hypothetical protein